MAEVTLSCFLLKETPAVPGDFYWDSPKPLSSKIQTYENHSNGSPIALYFCTHLLSVPSTQ